jgi:lysophospholipase L1-like esterase
MNKRLKLGNSSFIFFSVFLWLVVLVILAELILRFEPINDFVGVPYRGSTHRQLEIQLARIKNFSESESDFNCLFIGSSMVWLGINPEVFSDSYKHTSGEELKCFNFGVATMPAGAAAVITGILVKEYQPEIIIFGTSARDYAIPLDAEDYKVIVETPWVQYQSRNYSVAGWLYSNSYFYTHLRNFNRLLKFDRSVFKDIGINDFDRTGFLPRVGAIPEENKQTAFNDSQKWLAEYQVLEENADGLRKIAEYSKENIQVVFFETPVQSEYYSHFVKGEADFNKYVETISFVSSEYHVPYIRTNHLGIIPVDGWWDENHLNLKGANIFSWWLGEQMGTLAEQNKLNILTLKK